MEYRTDERIIDQAGKWCWRRSGTKEVSYQGFKLDLYPESWNENFVEAKFLPNQNSDVLVEEVLATGSQLRLSKLAWRVASSPDSLELESAGFIAEKMDELLARELSDGLAPILPELVISREVVAEQITNFARYQTARRAEAATFGHRMRS
jgi:hypothetical protein